MSSDDPLGYVLWLDSERSKSVIEINDLVVLLLLASRTDGIVSRVHRIRVDGSDVLVISEQLRLLYREELVKRLDSLIVLLVL